MIHVSRGGVFPPIFQSILNQFSLKFASTILESGYFSVSKHIV